jgi:hypothetical protein
MKTETIIERTYQGLLLYSPTTLAELRTLLPLSKTQIRNGLEKLRKQGKAKYHYLKWEAIPIEEVKPPPPLGPVTNEELDEVELLCTGKHLRELRDLLTHYSADRVHQVVRILRDRKRIHYSIDGWRQGIADISALPVSYTADRVGPQISKEDLAWMNYWKPANRQKRQLERWAA